MSWEEFLKDRTHFNLYVNGLVYMPTIKLIRRISRPGERLLETGCGSGRTAMLLADMGYQVTSLDISISLLQQQRCAMNFFKTLQLVNGNIYTLPFADKTFSLSYSCGVLEHFSPEKIILILAEQCRVAHHVLIDIPNIKCSKQSYGDENFYSDDHWVTMITQAGLVVEKILHRGMDRGQYVGNCSIFLTSDAANPKPLSEKTDVYDFYCQQLST